MNIILLTCLCCCLAAVEADVQQPSDAEKKAAEQRADNIIKELETTRLSVDPVSKKDLDQIDLLTRKAEAYILVEQPADAGQMLTDAQTVIAKYETDKRSELRRAINAYEQRLVVVAQALLKYTRSVDLDEKKEPDDKVQTPADPPGADDVNSLEE